MAITVGGLTIRALQDVPFAHGGDAQSGRTARRWPVKAVLSPADWLTLDGIYQAWRTQRLADADTLVSLAVGSTVATSGSVWGLTWSNVPAWFSQAPTPAPTGGMVSVSFELVDAAQQLAVILREQEVNTQVADNQSTYGTYTLGTIVLNLTQAPDDFEDGPQVALAATGTHVIRGPLAATEVKRISGWTHTVGTVATLRNWYRTQIATRPSAGSYWPVTPPKIDQTPVIVGGARVTRFQVSCDLKLIR